MKIFLDFDSTLVNFVNAWVDLINEKTEDQIHIDDIGLFHHPVLEKHKWLFLEYPIYDHVVPFEGSKEFVKQLCLDHDVTILTHTFSDFGKHVKGNYIKEHFGDLEVIQTTDPKWLWSRSGWLIDDGIHNIDGQLKNTNGEAVLYNHLGQYKYVPKDLKHERLHYTESYDEILNLLN